MRNKRLALSFAISSIFISNSSFADATIYGELHNSLDIVDVGATTNNTSYSNNKSFLGVKGGEKITDEISAIYQIEFGVAVGDGSGLTDRDQYVGLKTNIGSLTAGRMSTPFKKIGAKADLFWHSQLGQNRSLTRSNRSIRTGTSVGLDDMDGRFDNTIQYTSPNINGFQASVARVTESQNNDRGLSSGNITFDKGRMEVGVAIEKRDDLDIAGTTFVGSTAYRAMAAYDTGSAKLVGFYQKAEDQGFNEGFNSSVVGVGAATTVGNGIVKAQYYRASDLDIPASSGITDDNGASLFALGYDYKLSKHTVIYAQYAQINNDPKGGYGLGLGAGGHSAAVTTQINSSGEAEDQSGVSFGLKHDF